MTNTALYTELLFIFDKNNFSVPTNSKNITKEILVEFLSKQLSTSNGALGYSTGGWQKFIKKVFPNKPKGKHFIPWLLSLENKSLCTRCNTIKNLSEFWKNKNTTNGVNSYCKDCLSTYEKFYPERHAKKRAAKLNAIPKWANLNKIKTIYDNCPTGYHVDHIIPLQGKYICGLHVENNLQYLLASENSSKKNFHSSEECWRPIAAIGTVL
jgi:hypothetical protein